MNIEKENVIKNKNEAIRLLNNYLDTCISTDNKHLKSKFNFLLAKRLY